MYVDQAISKRRSKALLPYEVLKIVEDEVNGARFVKGCSDAYRTMVKDFVVAKARKMADSRDEYGMFEAMEHDDEWGDEVDLTLGASPAAVAALNNKFKVTENQLRTFLDLCWVKYVRARIEPGESFPVMPVLSLI